MVGNIEPDLRPRLLPQYYWWSDAGDADGVEGLHFASAQRRLRIVGRSLRKFERIVMPLLDGQRTVQEVVEAVADEFAAADVVSSLDLLAQQRVLEIVPPGAPDVGRPGVGFFHELGVDGRMVSERFARSTVAVVGLTGAGTEAAVQLAAAGVGHIRLIDDGTVANADARLSPVLSLGTGSSLAELAGRLAANFGATIQTHSAPFADADVASLVRGVDFVVCALDAGWSSLIYKLNRACLAQRVPWTMGTLEGAEVILGPTVQPYETACFTCYRMRAIAAAASPEDEFALERVRDNRKRDDSAARENIGVGAGMLANLLALEALKVLSGVVAPSALGSIIVTNLVRVTTSRHVVLRQPWCPDCFPEPGRP